MGHEGEGSPNKHVHGKRGKGYEAGSNGGNAGGQGKYHKVIGQKDSQPEGALVIMLPLKDIGSHDEHQHRNEP